jgi:hypothetical protein
MTMKRGKYSTLHGSSSDSDDTVLVRLIGFLEDSMMARLKNSAPVLPTHQGAQQGDTFQVPGIHRYATQLIKLPLVDPEVANF